MGVGGWVPERPDQVNSWIDRKLNELDSSPKAGPPDKSIQDFRHFIEHSAEAYMGFHRLFFHIPDKDPLSHRQVRTTFSVP